MSLSFPLISPHSCTSLLFPPPIFSHPLPFLSPSHHPSFPLSFYLYIPLPLSVSPHIKFPLTPTSAFVTLLISTLHPSSPQCLSPPLSLLWISPHSPHHPPQQCSLLSHIPFPLTASHYSLYCPQPSFTLLLPSPLSLSLHCLLLSPSPFPNPLITSTNSFPLNSPL